MSEIYTPLGEEVRSFDEEEEEEEMPSVGPFEGTAVLLRFGGKTTPIAVWSHQPNRK